MNLPFREIQGCEEEERILLPLLPYLGAAEEYESSSTRQIIQEQFFSVCSDVCKHDIFN